MPNPISGEFYLRTEESEPPAPNMPRTASHLIEPPVVTDKNM